VYPYGYSGSINELKLKGWKVSGCELDEVAVKIGDSSGLNIIHGGIMDVNFSANSFDVVRFNHVLEHSFSPMKDLSKAVQLLKKDGFIIISGPNINSAAYLLFGKYWSGLDLPRHLYHFTPEMLKKYFGKLNLVLVSDYFDSTVGDYIHSLKHFIHSLENKICSESNELSKIYKTDYNNLVQSIIPLINFFNARKLGDNYTIIGMKK